MVATTKSQNWIVVGGNRGIGLGLVREIAAQHPGDKVFATARDVPAAAELNDLANESKGQVVPLQADFTDAASMEALVEQIKKYTPTLDHVVINGGGAAQRGALRDMSGAELTDNFTKNVVGPHNAFVALAPLVEASTADNRFIACISASAGSIANIHEADALARSIYGLDHFPLAAYGIAKAAYNMLARQWALRLEPMGVAVIILHPGNVATDGTKAATGRGMKLISIEESATGTLKAIKEVDIKETNRGIYCNDGRILPW